MDNSREIPWPRILAEAGAIVVSILLAFGIDATWDEWQEGDEEQRILSALLDELRSNQARLAEKTQWHEDIKGAINQLLAEAASPSSTLSVESIDTLIGTASWFNNATTFEMSAIDSVVIGGSLPILDNESLRQRITRWTRDVSMVTRTEAQDYDNFSTVWMPFLRDNAYLPQIANAIRVQPGTGEEDYIADLPLGSHKTNHRDLLRDRGFQNALLHRLWVQADILYEYEQLEPRLSSLIKSLDAELDQ